MSGTSRLQTASRYFVCLRRMQLRSEERVCSPAKGIISNFLASLFVICGVQFFVGETKHFAVAVVENGLRLTLKP